MPIGKTLKGIPKLAYWIFWHFLEIPWLIFTQLQATTSYQTLLMLATVMFCIIFALDIINFETFFGSFNLHSVIQIGRGLVNKVS